MLNRYRLLFVVKKIVYSVLILVLAAGLVEALFPLVFRMSSGAPFQSQALLQRAEEIAAGGVAVEGEDEPTRVPSHMKRLGIHPYVGFSMQFKSDTNHPYRALGKPVDKMFRSDDKCIVGIFGGSVAAGLVTDALPQLKGAIRDRLGRQVHFVPFTVGGYKQPQQLMALSYMLAAGAEFDVVINVDGFNEVALPLAENKKLGLAPLFPRGWNWLSSELRDPEELALLGRLAEAGAARVERAEDLLESAFRWSRLRQYIWMRGDQRLAEQGAELESEIAEAGSLEKRKTTAYGPYWPLDDAGLMDLAGQSWKRCSQMMDALCRQYGIQYFHFLQPNQYVEGSKPLGKAERDVAYSEDAFYRPGVVQGYPGLRARGEELVAEGVAFHDMTMLFKDNPEPLYKDACCHFNPTGYGLLAEAISSIVASSLEVNE